MSIDTAVGAASKICGFVAPTVLRQFGYILYCERNATELKEHITRLQNAKARLSHRVDESTSSGEVIEDDVLTWLRNADKLIKSANLILETNKVRWFLGFVPASPRGGYKLGRKAKKCIPDFERALSDQNFEQVSYRLSLRVGAATSSSKRNIVALGSQDLVLASVMKSLDDDKIRAIGIYGMGGVGKTTVLNKVANQARRSNKFDGVVSVFVSQTPDMARISAEIQYRLELVRSTESSKTILILLDDLLKALNLKDVKIPEDDDKVKVRLVMTSRNQHLLVDEMLCHKTFSIGVLDEEEGRQFFAELVDIKVEELRKNPTTIELLKKCAGLPVSIEALATLWKKAAGKDLSSGDLFLNMDELIQQGNGPRDGSVSIEWSYNYLGDSYEEKQAKMLFRTIGLLGTPNVPVVTLLKYSVGLGLFENDTDINIMERARREVTRSLRMLQDSSLLLESDDINHVKIHDVVRDVAVAIASRDDHALISNPLDSVKGWSREKMKKSTAVSLSYSATQELHKGWKCPNAKIFIMKVGDEQGEPVELSDSFFQGMVKINVLHLEKARLTSLPSSIQSYMRNVTTLCLHYCYLGDVSMIGKLVSLQVLSFVGSELANLPEEIGDLSKLRMLDLSNCSELKAIAPGVLKRLTQLEELYMKESFQEWEVEGAAQQSNSSLAELNHLPHLNTLEVCVPDPSKLPSELPLKKLARYKVVTGDAWDKSRRDYKESRFLKLKMESGDILAEEWLQSALQKTQDLHLDGGSSGIVKSFHELCREGFEELKHLNLQNSSSIKYIIWSTEWLSSSAFTILESMILEKMESLEKICHGRIDSACFSRLKVIKVHECHKLRNLFNLSLLKGLVEVEEIEITECKMIHEIVWVERQEDDGRDALIRCFDDLLDCTGVATNANVGVSTVGYEMMLGRLRCLTLRSLPEMTTFFSNEAPTSSMGTIAAASTFFNDHQVSSYNRKPKKHFGAPKYKEIQASRQVEFYNLRKLELADCDNIVHLINSKMLLKLINLESLSIARCGLLEDIFDLQGIDGESGNTVEILPNLYELKLRELPMLEHIWKKHSRRIKGCAKLRTLEISKCEKLPYVFSSSTCQGMENLTEIIIGDCNRIETVILEEEGLAVAANDASSSAVTRLMSLKILAISDCPNLKAFLSGLNIEESTPFKCCIKGMCCRKRANSFFAKVLLPSLATLILSSVGEFKKLWCDEVTDRSYCNLKSITLERCIHLLTVFPATLIERLQNLRQLRLRSCYSLKTLIEVDVVWKTKRKPTALMLPQLQQLTLVSIPELRHIIKLPRDDSEIVIGFPSLTRLEVIQCGKLMYLMPSTTATTLLKLETLDIRECEKLQEVIHGKVSERNKRDDIPFPHLTSLTMIELESLTCFTSEDYLLDFACLKVLHILGCKLLETFVKQRSEDEEDQANTTSPQALFNDKVNLPNLEQLCISESHQVEEVLCSERQQRRSSGDSLCKLKRLRIDHCSRLRNVVPSFMIKRMQNMEGIEDSSVISVLPKLLSLELEVLPKLRNLSSSDSSYTLELVSLEKLTINNTGGAGAAAMAKVHLPNIDELYVGNEDITELWHSEPNGGSFCKLKDLKVKQCGQLVKIIPQFMLKRLHNLEKLVVKSCHQLETVCELGAGGGLNNVQESEGSLQSIPLQNLTSVQVENCQLLRNLFNIYGNGETTTCYKLITALPQLTNLRLQHLPNFSHLLFQQGELQYTFKMSSLKDFILIGSGVQEAVTQKVVFAEELEIRADDPFTFFGSSTTVERDVKNALQDQTNRNNQIIGLLGQISGKLSKSVDDLGLGQVLWCRNFSAEEIQNELEHALGIRYSGIRKEERAQRLHTVLLSNRDRPIILALDNVKLKDSINLEVEVGIPHLDELDPKFFRLMLISENVDVLNEMGVGAQQVINIGIMDDLWQRFRWDLIESKVVFGEQELPAVDDVTTNMKSDTSTFFDEGSVAPVMNDIMKALHSNQNNNNHIIIGLLVPRIILFLDKDLKPLLEQEAKPFQLLYLTPEDNNLAIQGIQNELGRMLGITYGNKRRKERVQCLRESLLNNQDKRLLLVLAYMFRAIDLEEAVGIPLKRLNPDLFKIILVSKRRELLDKMGVQLVIDVPDDIDIFGWWIGKRILDGYLGESEFRKLADECGSHGLVELLVDKLKGQGWRAWENAYQRLKDTPFEYNARMMVIYSLPA